MAIPEASQTFQTLSFTDGARLSFGLMRGGQETLIEQFKDQTESVYFEWPAHLDKLLRLSKGIAVIVDPADAKELLDSHHDSLVKDSRDIRIIREFLGGSLVPHYGGEDWWDRRKLVAPSFSHAKVIEFGDTISQFAQEKLREWEQGGFRDIPMRNDLTEQTIRVITDYMFHAQLPADAITDIREHITVIATWVSKRIRNMGYPPRWLPTADNEKFNRSLSAIHAVLEDIYARRAQGELKDDMFSVLCAAHYDDHAPLTKQYVIDESLSMLIAGHETTANMLSWTLYELSRNMEVQQSLYQELRQVIGDRVISVHDLKQLPLLSMVIKESARLHPPVWMFTRKSVNDIRLSGGRTIPEKSFIVLSPLFMHRNTKYWTNPHEFNPKRFDPLAPDLGVKDAYMPFGYSKRSCLGQDLATTEAKMILANILQKGLVKTQDNVHAEMLITNRPSTPMISTIYPHASNT